VVEHSTRDPKVRGSNPVTPSYFFQLFLRRFHRQRHPVRKTEPASERAGINLIKLFFFVIHEFLY
jgi:hypothetical protein